MADTAIAITAGSGTNVDTRTEATNGNHRQVVVLGDPSTNAGVAPVDATAGLKVDLGTDNDVTVTGTVDLGATDNEVLDAIAADTGTIAGDTTSIDAKIPALGQALAAASVPVVLTASQLTTLTPPAAISGFATAAKQDTIIGHVDGVETLLGTIDADTSTLAGAVAGTEMQVDVVSSALPTGASTAAKQPALGTAGTASSDVITVQGIASMTALKVDGSGVTQPVSGTVAVTNAGITTIAGAVSGTEMQVDVVAALPAGTNTVGSVKITDGTDVADILDLTNSNPVAVAIVDGSGDQISSFGGGTQYTEDAAAAANPVGTALMLVREDGRAGSLTTTDGDNVAARGNNKGELYVKTTDSDALLTTIDADTSNISTKIDTVAGAVAGTEMQVDVLTMPTVAVTQSGTWDEVGINDSGNSITVDYATTGSGTATGALRVELPTNGTGVIATVGAVTAITNALPAGTNAIGKLAANSGVDIGDVDVTSLPALAAGTNAVGKLLPPDIDVTAHTNYAKKYYTSAGAATDGIVWSPAAGKRWHVASMYIQVSAAATVTLEDDKAGGDEAVFKSEFAANSGTFLVFPEKYPLASGEDAADLLITTSAGNVYVTVTGYEV